MPTIIHELWVDGHQRFAPDDINVYGTLRKLVVQSNTGLHDIGICNLTNLEQLTLTADAGITDVTILRLTKLRSLNLGFPHGITSTAIASATWLTRLSILDSNVPRRHGPPQYLTWLSSSALAHHTGLKNLMLAHNMSITVEGFSNLVSLTVLNVVGGSLLSDEALRYTVSLTGLVFNRGIFGDRGLWFVRKTLKVLSMSSPTRTTDRGMATLRSLSILIIAQCRNLTGSFLPLLTQLREIEITDTSFEGQYIARISTSLESLSLDQRYIGPCNMVPSHLRALDHLRFLSIGPVKISMLPVFSVLTNLRFLRINDFGGITESAISTLPISLTSLSFDCGYGQRRPVVPTSCVTRLTRLTELNLPYQSDILPYHITPLVRLTRLVAGINTPGLQKEFRKTRGNLLIVERNY